MMGKCKNCRYNMAISGCVICTNSFVTGYNTPDASVQFPETLADIEHSCFRPEIDSSRNREKIKTAIDIIKGHIPDNDRQSVLYSILKILES